MRALPAFGLLAMLLAACGGAAPAPDAARPGSLSVTVGGSAGMSAASIR